MQREVKEREESARVRKAYNGGGKQGVVRRGDIDIDIDLLGSMGELEEMVESGKEVVKVSRGGLSLKGKVLLGLVLLGVSIGGVKWYQSRAEGVDVVVPDVAVTRGDVVQELETALKEYNVDGIRECVSGGESYLAKEWGYAYGSKVRESFVKTVWGNTSLKELGDGVVEVESIDWVGVGYLVSEDRVQIQEMYKDLGIGYEDPRIQDQLTDVFINWLVGKGNLPTKKEKLNIGVSGGVIQGDEVLDEYLFSTKEFHEVLDQFARVALDWKEKKEVVIWEWKKVRNPEYDKWDKLFQKYYKEDGGRFRKGVSKWEPFYLRTSDGKDVYKNGKRVVNYYTVKDKNGKDWVQPQKEIKKKVKRVVKEELEFPSDRYIPHCFIGAYFCENVYNGINPHKMRVGDGSYENPLGVGTPVITKVLGTDGKYHNVRVTMLGYMKGQPAIDYAISFSEKNRGIDPKSVVKFLSYELKVENLEDYPISISSEMYVGDNRGNKYERVGVMYGYLDKAKIKPYEYAIINDWYNVMDPERKYVLWGKSFNKKIEPVYFRVEAGQDGGVSGTYSAYDAFTGNSELRDREQFLSEKGIESVEEESEEIGND